MSETLLQVENLRTYFHTFRGVVKAVDGIMVPSMLDLPQGCYFAPRCKYCQDICRTVTPENHEVSPGHCAACHFPLTGGESHE